MFKLKLFWQKIRQNHLLLMVACCLIPIVLIIVFISLFKGNSNYWIWLIILLCPLIHIWMIREYKDHNHNSGEDKLNQENDVLYKCPECELEYKEKEWTEKCQTWCQEHQSCNLEIIRQ